MIPTPYEDELYPYRLTMFTAQGRLVRYGESLEVLRAALVLHHYIAGWIIHDTVTESVLAIYPPLPVKELK